MFLNRNLFLLSVLVVSWFSARSQTLPDIPLPRYKWDVGTDLLFLVNRNTVPPSVFVRLNNDNFTAWRFRIGGSYHQNVSWPKYTAAAPTNSLLSLRSSAEAFISVGREWQRVLGPFQFFFGTDVFFHHKMQRGAEQIIWISQPPMFSPYKAETSVGISPFVGIKYAIIPRLSVSAESHLGIVYRRFRWEYFSSYQNGETEIRNLYWRYFSVIYDKPLYVLNLMFHF